MAGLFDVLNTLGNLVATACYPNGVMSPSVTTRQVTIEQGFPIRTQQDLDLSSGYSHVSVYPTSKERVVTKFERNFVPVTLTAATLIATVDDTEITLSGTVSIPQSVMVICDGVGYGYGVQAGDTVNSIAASVAALIPGATATLNVISIPSSYSLVARIGTNYSAGQELSRVDRVFQIVISSPTPADRATLTDAIDVYLKQNYRITLSDGFTGMVFYNDTKVDDMLQKSEVFKTILEYTIQYPTTVIQSFITITDPFVDSITVE